MRIGFIGHGNMAKAMISGILKSEMLPEENIFVSNSNAYNQKAVDFADYIFLTIKPQIYEEVMENLIRTKNKIFITVTPGISTKYASSKLGDAKIIRTMPNTPALVGEGVTAICRGTNVIDSEFEFAKKLLSGFSTVYEFEESQMDNVVALSGSSPAYAYMFIEAIANYSSKCGINLNTAQKMAAQTLLGSAKMVLESDELPGKLCKRVCSKGGTTIKAVEKLKELGFSDVIEHAMEACIKRAKELVEN